jgi:hypothetical protein
MATGSSDRKRHVRTGTGVVRAVVARVTTRRVTRRGAVLLALLVPLVVALGIMPASANSGTLTLDQNCQTWHARVVLNHDVRPDRMVNVVTTIPGTKGISRGHYNMSFGQIWSASGHAPTSGTVTLNIYYANGRREFTETKALHAPRGCVTTTTKAPTTKVSPTTAAPATSTSIASLGSTATSSPPTVPPSTVAERTKVSPSGETVSPSTSMPSAVTTAGEAAAVEAANANALPLTGGGGPGPAIGVVSLLGGAVMLLVSRARRGRAT